MSSELPPVSGKTYPPMSAYQPHFPRKNVLVISCIDLRLTDDLLNFLHFDNLHNRYDLFTLAGCSLCCTDKHAHLLTGPGYDTDYEIWKSVAFHHIDIAIALHHIEDVYLVEHQDCGAYKEFLGEEAVKFESIQEEMDLHKKFTDEFAEIIKVKYEKLNVHSFFIDLRGNVINL